MVSFQSQTTFWRSHQSLGPRNKVSSIGSVCVWGQDISRTVWAMLIKYYWKFMWLKSQMFLNLYTIISEIYLFIAKWKMSEWIRHSSKKCFISINLLKQDRIKNFVTGMSCPEIVRSKISLFNGAFVCCKLQRVIA